MANYVLALALLLSVIAAGENAGLVMMAEAQSPPPPSSSCGASLAGLAPCLAFLQAGRNNSSPTQGCCTALASLVDTSTVCVCQLLSTTNNPVGIPINNIPQGIPINQTRALTLPGACKITSPSLTQCTSAAGGAGAPVATPVSSPSAPATSSPSPAATSISDSPATSVIPPSTTGGILAPSGSHEGPTASANAGSMMSFSMSSILIVGILNIIAATISA